MKLSTKIILPIILISALLILLAGCFGIPDSSPGYTPGSITGRIVVPPNCIDCLDGGPCFKGISNDGPSGWVPVEDAIVTVIPHATLTDEDGYYTLSNVEPGVYYVITATYKNLVLKDVVEPDGVEAGKIYDAGTANCESTALGLVVEALLDMGLETEEDIGSALEMYIESDKFTDLVATVCCIIEDCDNVTLYCDLVEFDEPEYTPELELITVNTGSMNLCLNDNKSITPLVSVIAHYTEGEPSKTVTSLASITYSSNDSDIASISGTRVTGEALGSTTIDVSATYIEDEVTKSATGTIPVNVIDCSTCIPELDSLTVVLGNTTPMTLCNGDTITIDSSHIASIIAHYTCDAPDVTLLLSDCSYESENSGIASVSGLDVTGNSVGSTNIVVSYTDLGKTVTATQEVPVKVEDCTTLNYVTVSPSPLNLCAAGTGTTETETGTIVTTAHYSDGTSAVVTPDSYDIWNTNIVASVSSAGLVTSGSTVGSTAITVNFEDKSADVPVNVEDCTVCTPELDSLTVVLGNTTPMTLCNGDTITIDSSHIASIIAHYTCDAPDVTLLLSDCSYESENSGIASVSGLDVTGNSVGSTNIVVSYTDLGKTVTATQKVPVEVKDCTPPCISADLSFFSLEIKEGGSWTEYLGSVYPFDPNTLLYNVVTTNFAEHFRFTVDAECVEEASLYYNWYRGISCTDDWLTGESGYSEPPSTWIPITSGGTYPTSTSDRPVCNKGGNVLFIKVTNAEDTKIYKVYVDRPNP